MRNQTLEALLPASFGEAAAQADEWGRLPWVGWVSRPVTPIADMRPADLADVLVELVAAEGPVTVGRAFDLVLTASGVPRHTAAISKALESGLAAGVRRGALVAARGRHGHPDTRILRLPTQPEVVLRQPGDRDIGSIPHSEIAELARRVWARTPDATRDEVKRQVARLLGASRYTAAVDELLTFAMPPTALR